MMDITNTAMVPIEDLYLHPLNVRSEPPSAEIEALAHSIRDKGLIQNLSGWADPEREGMIGIVAGGRRLRALRLLAKQDGVFSVPVKLAADAAEARDWAGTENTARAALHPADEIRAYGNMRSAGRTNDQIARAFAVSTKHVARRIALADLPDNALTGLREGRITLETAQELTMIGDKARQAQLAEWAVAEEAAAYQVRSEISRGKLRGTDRRALFVGLAAYEAAGGGMDRGLFSDDVYLHDSDLLESLFSKRLEEEAEILRDEGFAWVNISATEAYGWDLKGQKGFERTERPTIQLPEADQAELDDLEDIVSWQRTAEQKARFEELRERTVGTFEPDQYPDLGVTIYVNNDGKLSVAWFARKGDQPEEGTEASRAEVKPEKIPQNLKDDLAAISLLAVQKKLMAQPELLLDLFAYQMSCLSHTWDAPLGIRLDFPRIEPEKPDGTLVPEALTRQSLTSETNRGKSSPAAFAQFQAQGKKHRNAIIALMFARCFSDKGGLGPVVAHQLKVDVRDVWIPTAAGYLSRLTVDALEAIRVDLVPEDAQFDVAEWAAMKKADKAKWLDRLFNDLSLREALKLSREQNAAIDKWLPAELIWPVPELAEEAA